MDLREQRICIACAPFECHTHFMKEYFMSEFLFWDTYEKQNFAPTGGKDSAHCSADCCTACCEPHRIACGSMVDDLLALLRKTRVKEDVALIVATLSALGVPISWRKAQLGANITWCGWTFNFDCETVRLTAEKLAKLRAQLQELRRSKKIMRKKLESGLGLLMWATSTARHLRPYLAPPTRICVLLEVH